MTVRLTVAQALVRFLASQYTERDAATATWRASARPCSRPSRPARRT